MHPASQVAAPAAAGLFLLAQGAVYPGAMMLLMGGLAAFAFYLWCALVCSASCPASVETRCHSSLHP